MLVQSMAEQTSTGQSLVQEPPKKPGIDQAKTMEERVAQIFVGGGLEKEEEVPACDLAYSKQSFNTFHSCITRANCSCRFFS